MTDKRTEPCTDARELVVRIRGGMGWNEPDGSYISYTAELISEYEAAALIQSAFDKIRRDEQDKYSEIKMILQDLVEAKDRHWFEVDIEYDYSMYQDNESDFDERVNAVKSMWDDAAAILGKEPDHDAE